MAEAAAEDEAGTPADQGTRGMTRDYTNSERGGDDFGGEKRYDRWEGRDRDRDYKRDKYEKNFDDRERDEDKFGGGSYKDAGYKTKSYKDEEEPEFKSRGPAKKEFSDPPQSPANVTTERTGVVKVRGGGGTAG